MIELSQFEWLSFDCYGTLINWEAGILGYIRPLLQRKGCRVSDDKILNLYSEFEPGRQQPPYRSYREVLAGVVKDFAGELRVEVTNDETRGLADSIRNWETFPDTV